MLDIEFWILNNALLPVLSSNKTKATTGCARRSTHPQFWEPKLHRFLRFCRVVPLITNDLQQFGSHQSSFYNDCTLCMLLVLETRPALDLATSNDDGLV